MISVMAPHSEGPKPLADGWRRARAFALVLPLAYLALMLSGALVTIQTGDDGLTCAIPGTVLPHECVVTQVAAGSPAERAAIHPGDTVVATDGVLFIPPDGVLRWFYHPAAGAPVTLSVQRADAYTAASPRPAEDVPILLQSRIQAFGVAQSFVPWT